MLRAILLLQLALLYGSMQRQEIAIREHVFVGEAS